MELTLRVPTPPSSPDAVRENPGKPTGPISNLPRVRELTIDDFQRVDAVCRRNGRRAKSLLDWQHRWKNNPLYRSLACDWPMGWLLECGDEVCGSIENIPVPYEMDGRPVTAAVGCSWAVDPPYRGYAALLADYFYNQSRADLCVGTTVNAEAFPVLTELGVQKVPVGAWDHTGIWIADYAAVARNWLQARGVPLARAISSVLGPAIFIADKANGRVPSKCKKHCDRVVRYL
jgi:hypothetical protein